jgi:hypothetical protein
MGQRHWRRQAVVLALLITGVWVLLGWILGSRVVSIAIEEEHELYGPLKMHGVIVANRSPWPVRINECRWRYIHDPTTPSSQPASAVERWDANTSRWVVFSEYHMGFCDSYPDESLGNALQRRWLWPTQQTAVPPAVILDPTIRRGDRVRFVVYLAWPNTSRDVVTSPPFVIDQCDFYPYRPEGWQRVAGRDLHQWTSPAGIELATEFLEGCDTEEEIETTFYMGNTSEHAIVLAGAELMGSGSSPDAHDAVAGTQVSIPSGGSQRLVLRWTVDRLALDFLGSTPSLVLTFRVGEEVVSIPVAYTRAW